MYVGLGAENVPGSRRNWHLVIKAMSGPDALLDGID